MSSEEGKLYLDCSAGKVGNILFEIRDLRVVRLLLRQ